MNILYFILCQLLEYCFIDVECFKTRQELLQENIDCAIFALGNWDDEADWCIVKEVFVVMLKLCLQVVNQVVLPSQLLVVLEVVEEKLWSVVQVDWELRPLLATGFVGVCGTLSCPRRNLWFAHQPIKVSFDWTWAPFEIQSRWFLISSKPLQIIFTLHILPPASSMR